jgi:hypothetical protein
VHRRERLPGGRADVAGSRMQRRFASATTAVSFLSVFREVPAARATSSIPPCPSQRACAPSTSRCGRPRFQPPVMADQRKRHAHQTGAKQHVTDLADVPLPEIWAVSDLAVYQVAWAGLRICISRVHKRRTGVSGDMATGQASPGWARPPDHREGALPIRARRQAQNRSTHPAPKERNC